MSGERFEHVAGPIPGPRSRALNALVERYESPGVTYLAADYPIVWSAAQCGT